MACVHAAVAGMIATSHNRPVRICNVNSVFITLKVTTFQYAISVQPRTRWWQWH